MSDAALSGLAIAGRSHEIIDQLPPAGGRLSKFLREVGWSSLTPWMVADLVIAQCAAITALCAGLVRLLSTGAVFVGPNTTRAVQNYVDTMVPLAAVFPLFLLVNRCYSKAQSVNNRQMALRFFRAFLMSYGAYALVKLYVGPPGAFYSVMGLGFLGLATAGSASIRWFKHTVDPPQLRKSAALHLRSAGNGKAPVLVVGGAGYIGSILVRRLIAAGKKVRVLDNLVYGNASLRALFGHPNMELLVGDCRNLKDVVNAVGGVDTIIHLAAIVGDPACEQERQTALETNYAATRMLIEVAKGAKVNRLLFASTCSVYGASDELMDETSGVAPISLYAQTKIQSEHALMEAASESFHPIIVRLATVFGHSYRPRFDLVVNLLTAKAHQEGVITIFNGQQWRPFIHVRDVSEGMMMLLDTPVSVVGRQVFNLGDSRLNYTLEQVAGAIRKIFTDTRVEFVDNEDRRNYRVSFDKIQRLVGFQTSVGLEDGIRELREAFDRRLVEDYKLALYSNQCFLQRSGTIHSSNEVDTYVMAAFARHFQALAEAGSRPA